jgi:hypothetical protein
MPMMNDRRPRFEGVGEAIAAGLALGTMIKK